LLPAECVSLDLAAEKTPFPMGYFGSLKILRFQGFGGYCSVNKPSSPSVPALTHCTQRCKAFMQRPGQSQHVGRLKLALGLPCGRRSHALCLKTGCQGWRNRPDRDGVSARQADSRHAGPPGPLAGICAGRAAAIVVGNQTGCWARRRYGKKRS